MSAVQAVSRPEEPHVFGRYLLLRRLSRGGMGEIYLAKLGEIQGFEKLVIIKKILPNLVADEEFIKRFIDEAQVAIKLNHANIAPVFEVGRVDGEYFLAIEYVEGRDLRRTVGRLREEGARLPPDLCLYVAREIASGLAYAHRRTDEAGRSLALVHCDISPPNVMVSFEGEVKIIDFGIAKSAIRIAGSNPNMGFGKFGYMAPEQLLKGGVVDRRTDLYATGVVLYELLCGERLLSFPEGADYREIARTVTAGKFPPPSQRDPRLDPELDAIVMRALATQKDDRYQSAEELRDAIQVKLAQMNPTISADALAHFVRGLFRDEIADDRALVASLEAVDLAPFQEELTLAGQQHTVTFARSGLGARGAAGTPMPARGATAEQLRAHPLRRTLFFAAGGAAMIAGGAIAFVVGTAPPSRKPLEGQASSATPRPGVSAPVVRPLAPDPPPSGLDLAKRPKEGVAASGARRSAPGTVRSGGSDRRHKDEPKSGRVSAERIEQKFRVVKREYAAFKGQYGSVLEERWNQIAAEITFGRGNKNERVEAMLEALQREMARVRRGG